MNRKILIEEVPGGGFVVSTNFPSGSPGAEMSVHSVQSGQGYLSSEIERIIDTLPEDPFADGMRRASWYQQKSALQRGPEDDEIPF